MVSKIPLSLTFLRIIIIPIFVFAFFIPGEIGKWTTCGLFIFACITDYLDGKLARSLNQESKLGALLDPIADKIIVAVAIILLIHDETIKDLTLFAALIIISREILVSGLREFLASLQLSLPVSSLSKAKTFIQMFALSVLLSGEPGNNFLLGYGRDIGLFSLWVAAVVTVYTGYVYLVKGLKHI
ncbi:CDP-diacylglycerol--glycerol-3-phosphate 3-phosphatidyltransferase [bacterium]|nr:CDP-diacylglycerol--glycerol-3-phosphate 3-phosphatidyltransferase [bacterium]|tara:strand:+ start:2101 stop:2655 length:555 start_codon:yes stop_codon:yes gene_type:complete